MNFKIRVVENIGSDSEDAFGYTGTVLEVVSGEFEDLDKFSWSNDGKLFHDIADVKKYFTECDDSYQTDFELVTEMEEPTK